MATAAVDRIQKTPGVCGGEACIGARRIAVWMLVNARRLGSSDADLLDAYDPPLTTDDLTAAWEYYDRYPAEIDAAVRRNEQAD